MGDSKLTEMILEVAAGSSLSALSLSLSLSLSLERRKREERGRKTCARRRRGGVPPNRERGREL
jgi:hypothetical protein